MRTFVFYPQYLDIINGLQNDQDKLAMYEAIVHYGCDEPYEIKNDPSGALHTLFNATIKPGIDRAQDRYAAAVENGAKGGAKEDWQATAKELLEAGTAAKEVAELVNVKLNTLYKSRVWKEFRAEKSGKILKISDEGSQIKLENSKKSSKNFLESESKKSGNFPKKVEKFQNSVENSSESSEKSGKIPKKLENFQKNWNAENWNF